MANKMIIDASHPEETRVVVLRGNRVEEFDFESASKKQLRGNIYLAKVTRVEPSLQAAFVEYGGNRHGFLAFSEIHPDYYQIPHADRVALLEEESRAHREEEDEENGRRRSRRHRRGSERRRPNDDERVSSEVLSDEDAAAQPETEASQADAAPAPVGEAAETVHASETVLVSETILASETLTAETTEGQPAATAAEPVEVSGETVASAPEAPAVEAAPLATAPVEQLAPVEAAPVAEAHVAEAHVAEAHVVETHVEPAPVAETLAEPAPHAEAPHEGHQIANDPEGFAVVEETDEDEDEDEEDGAPAYDSERDEFQAAAGGEEAHDSEAQDSEARSRRFLNEDQDAEHGENGDGEEEEIVDQLGGDAMDETPYRAPRLRRQYKIQEVIKRRQVLLIQVVKEERGNKGAALTTYLSLAGRYSVLMPNTARGGGISRKITDAVDRKRLKEIAQELEVPEGMGVILRTAGASRTKPEVKRDFEYLMRMWETVREMTLSSSAPALVYEEGSLIKRAIRDLYNKDIDDVMVAGEAGFREARDFMRLLMPSHVKNVQYYRDPQPVFAKYGAESQLDALFHNQVTLKSGGYLVINQTEALVAIDVNSGRSTREHNIEDTALRTNLEAADEVARQLRLRDLAGLIVVDFIDMEENRNNRAVERRIKDALKDDRARIQVGRISHFGLLEMSRQRIRTGVLEGSSVICPHCAGAGTVRSTASVAVHVMRVLEDALIKSASHNVILRTRTDIALYILNQKRSLLRLIEERFGVAVTVEADDSLTGGAYHALERGEPAAGLSGDPMRRFDPRRPIDDIEPIGEAEIGGRIRGRGRERGRSRGEKLRRSRRRAAEDESAEARKPPPPPPSSRPRPQFRSRGQRDRSQCRAAFGRGSGHAGGDWRRSGRRGLRPADEDEAGADAAGDDDGRTASRTWPLAASRRSRRTRRRDGRIQRRLAALRRGAQFGRRIGRP